MLEQTPSFWVYPTSHAGECYVVYRANKQEILVEVKRGSIFCSSKPLTLEEQEYFNTNLINTDHGDRY